MLDHVLIVGAGPTGLTAALELSRLGIAVRIIDKQSAPPTTSRAVGVQARTLELLELRGLAALPTWHFQSSPQTLSTHPIHKSLSIPPLRCEATDFGPAGTALASGVAGKGKRKASEGGPETFR